VNACWRRLRVLITADPDLPVLPRFYGGIERIVDLLVTGLTSRGHDVTLVAHRTRRRGPRSCPIRRRAPASPRPCGTRSSTVRRCGSGPTIHSFGRVATRAHAAGASASHVVPNAPSRPDDSGATRLSRGSITWTACSRHIAAPVDHLGPWRVIYNAVPVDRFRFSASVAADGPLVFLGRIEAVKGPHLAIRVARESGRRLLIAGNVPDDLQSRSYFREQVEPHVDGTSVVYCGPVDDQREEPAPLEAAALLYAHPLG
jgi:glycosyltransferase involved in cell wall biosynthesis